jgi:hypothetical protein
MNKANTKKEGVGGFAGECGGQKERTLGPLPTPSGSQTPAHSFYHLLWPLGAVHVLNGTTNETSPSLYVEITRSVFQRLYTVT